MIYRIVKQTDRSNQDVVGEKCVLNDTELSLSDDEKIKDWIEHYSRLLNIEFDCPSDDLVDVQPIVVPHHP